MAFEPPWSKLLFSLLRSGLLSPKIRALVTATRLPTLSLEAQRNQVLATAGPAREGQILPVRDKCGAQRCVVHGLPLRLCGATFDSSGPIYALASTHCFVDYLSCSRTLSTRRCHHIKSFLNRKPSHPVNLRRFSHNFLLPGTPGPRAESSAKARLSLRPNSQQTDFKPPKAPVNL